MSDLTDDLRALVKKWRIEGPDAIEEAKKKNMPVTAMAIFQHLACADELDAILARQDTPPNLQLEKDLYEMVQHHRPPSTPPMTREALEEAERQALCADSDCGHRRDAHVGGIGECCENVGFDGCGCPKFIKAARHEGTVGRLYTWECGCGAVNGVNLAECGVCRRHRSEAERQGGTTPQEEQG